MPRNPEEDRLSPEEREDRERQMTQAPTPGPLSGNDVNRECKACGAFKAERDASCTFCGLAPTAPVEASGSERGAAGAVMDALWPLLGGNHTSAELWHEISDAVSQALRPQPSGETRELLGHSVNLGFKTDEPTLRQMIEHYYRSHSMLDPMKWADRYVAALLSALGGQQGEEGEVQYEVWGAGPQGDFCAGSDTLSDAQHYAAVYGQDGPVVIKVATTTRVDWSEASSALATTPARAEAQDEGAALSASDRACYEYPGKNQSDLRAAFVAGACFIAAHPSPTPAADADRVQMACEIARDAMKCEGPEHELIYQRDRSALDRIATGPNLQRAIAAALKSTAAKEGGERPRASRNAPLGLSDEC